MGHTVLDKADLMKLTTAAREAQARVVFDIATVGGLMKERASRGYEWVHVRQTQPMKLKDTRAAATLIKWLAKCGCRVDWKDIPAREGDPMSPLYQHAELYIYWSKAFDQITVPAEKWLNDTGIGATSSDGE